MESALLAVLLYSSLHIKGLFGVKFMSILQRPSTQKLVFLLVSTGNTTGGLALVSNKVFTVIS